jgi:hypothetical protein
MPINRDITEPSHKGEGTFFLRGAKAPLQRPLTGQLTIGRRFLVSLATGIRSSTPPARMSFALEYMSHVVSYETFDQRIATSPAAPRNDVF